MKAEITYLGEFTIPKMLLHDARVGANDEYRDQRVFSDQVRVYTKPDSCVKVLRLSSHCGVTDFEQWTEKDDHFVIPENCPAKFDGARNAYNAVSGIIFPGCVVTNIKSTLGSFETFEDYDRARDLSLRVVRAVERAFRESHSPNQSIAKLANHWLGDFREVLNSVIGTEFHVDGSKGYLS